MSSNEVVTERKAIEAEFQKNVNITTGQLADAKAVFENGMRGLQKKCPHIWDNEEPAIQKLSKGISICMICRKKFETL